MPAYPFLVERKLDGKDTAKKMEVLRTLGVPYTDEDIAGAKDAVKGNTTPVRALGMVNIVNPALGGLVRVPVKVKPRGLFKLTFPGFR